MYMRLKCVNLNQLYKFCTTILLQPIQTSIWQLCHATFNTWYGSCHAICASGATSVQVYNRNKKLSYR